MARRPKNLYRHPKNLTRYATLDKYAADPRIEKIWEEGPDGIFADLAPGYNVEGCSSIHGEPDRWGENRGKGALQSFIEQFGLIEKGDPY